MRQQTRPLKEPAEKVVQDIRRATRKHYSAERRSGSCWKVCVARTALPSCVAPAIDLQMPALQHECRLAYVPTTVPSGRPSRGIMIVFRRTLCRLGVASRCCFNRRVSDAAVLAAMLTERARMEGASRQARPHNSEQPCTVPVCVSLPPP